jgi:hypothetical protein
MLQGIWQRKLYVVSLSTVLFLISQKKKHYIYSYSGQSTKLDLNRSYCVLLFGRYILLGGI